MNNIETNAADTPVSVTDDSPKMRTLMFLYNPRSGKGLIKQNLFDIINILTTGGFYVTAYPSQRPLDVHDKIISEGDKYDVIAVSGGDGTLSEAVSAFMEAGIKKPLGYIPAGSTNDFAASMGISRDMQQAARDIVEGVEFAYDIGRFNGKYFVYVAALGMFTDVTYETPQQVKNVLGHAAYVLEGMRRLPSYKGTDLTVYHDGIAEWGNFIVGLISNSRSIGGMAIPSLENTSFDDGLLEVSLVRTPENPLMLQQTLNDILSNRVEYSKNVLAFSTSDLTLISEEGISWTTDGESGGVHNEVEIKCFKRAIKIIVPRRAETERQTAAIPMIEKTSAVHSASEEKQADE